MGKKKKITEKVKLFYRGPQTKPTKVADENEMLTIACAFEDCIAHKDSAFETRWSGEKISLQVVVGLSASLRCLRQQRTRAIIYDDTASPHLTNYLNEFASKCNLPTLQAQRLIDIAPKLNLKTLLVVSIADVAWGGTKEIFGNKIRVRPNRIKDTVVSEAFDKLCYLLQTLGGSQKGGERTFYKLPVLDKVSSTGVSKAKKEARGQLKKRAKVAESLSAEANKK